MTIKVFEKVVIPLKLRQRRFKASNFPQASDLRAIPAILQSYPETLLIHVLNDGRDLSLPPLSLSLPLSFSFGFSLYGAAYFLSNTNILFIDIYTAYDILLSRNTKHRYSTMQVRTPNI